MLSEKSKISQFESEKVLKNSFNERYDDED